ncbi:hypothetical protein PZA11_006821 [Diplocarpon coronariae]|nr:hypothetical protein JHW43_006467 [Diplocarpon mali]
MGRANESHAVESDVLQCFLIENPKVEFVQFQWVDYSGVMEVRVATQPLIPSLDQKKQKSSTPSQSLNAVSVDGSLVDEVHFGIDHAHPDWSSVNTLPYHPNNAAVMCFVEEREQPTDTEFLRCPCS